MATAAPFGSDTPGASETRSDIPGLTGVQASAPRGILGAGGTGIRTLVALRAALIVGEIAMLLAMWRVMKSPLPMIPCGALVAAAAMVNLGLVLFVRARNKPRPRLVDAQLAFDIVQMAGLLHFTGGVANPFALLIIAPVTVGGGALPPRHALGLCAVAMIAILAVAFTTGHAAGPARAIHDAYRLASTLALLIATGFAGGYAIWTSGQDARRELALNVTETVLAREQRLSALGALSAAVAHELGTPLATITIIATEMAREAPEGPMRDDAVLMVEQAKRCRDILRRLAEKPERQDALHERMSLLQFVREIVEPHAKGGEVRVEAVVTGAPGTSSPDLWRRPEIVHAISAFVENAIDFARGEILLTARFDASFVTVEVRDDGPGFAPAILPRLGEPYVTSRPSAEGSRGGHIGMGLGLFIAKTLLERSGGSVTFANGPRLGAVVTTRWPRSRVEAPGAGW